jgi:hypothetical protein
MPCATLVEFEHCVVTNRPMMLADDLGVRKGERQRALDPNQDRKHHDDPRRTVASGRLQSEAWPVSDRYGWPASYCKPWPAPRRENFDEFVAVLQTLSLN